MFDYKMACFKRLKKHVKYLLSEEVPVLLAGVDTHIRGWEKSSDHAPARIILAHEDET
ncbi:hypothetical protein [Dyadobacter sp. OTU695]|uniref:hypothetical protein n=1 Tax=Dyadobacter sp. OTU695 TaxID=3043860 RepID=UPI00313B9D91